MGALDSKKKLKELYLPTTRDFVLVEVPELQFIMVDGEGDPAGKVFQHMIRWLLAVVQPIKAIARRRMGERFVEPPLECLWWSDDVDDLISGRRDRLKWRLMIVASMDWLRREMFEQAVAQASAKWGEVPTGLRLDRYTEGLSVQIMHIGAPGTQASTVARLHNEFLPAHHLTVSLWG